MMRRGSYGVSYMKSQCKGPGAGIASGTEEAKG